MFKLIGLLIIINSIIFTAWWVASAHPHKGWVFTLCLVAVFAGIFLIIQERATEVSVRGVGTIKAAAEKATSDAEAITKLKQRVETQSATIDLVAKEAAKARELSEELSKRSDEVESKLKTLDSAVIQAHKNLDQLQVINEFTTTVIAAQNDDRNAFDQLKTWADNKSFSLSTQAEQAWNKIFDEHAQPFYASGFRIPWRENIDSSKLTLKDLRNIYQTTPSPLKPAMIEFIWQKKDFSKRKKMEFLLDILKNDSSLKAVEYAGRFFAQGAGLKIKPLAVDYFLKWWDENKDSVK